MRHRVVTITTAIAATRAVNATNIHHLQSNRSYKKGSECHQQRKLSARTMLHTLFLISFISLVINITPRSPKPSTTSFARILFAIATSHHEAGSTKHVSAFVTNAVTTNKESTLTKKGWPSGTTLLTVTTTKISLKTLYLLLHHLSHIRNVQILFLLHQAWTLT